MILGLCFMLTYMYIWHYDQIRFRFYEILCHLYLPLLIMFRLCIFCALISTYCHSVVLYSNCPLCLTVMFIFSCLSEYSCYFLVLYLNCPLFVLPFDLELAAFVLLPWCYMVSGLSIFFNRPLTSFTYLFTHSFYVLIIDCFRVETVDILKNKFCLQNHTIILLTYY
jgi:hypothetical protein